jgi:putative component of toxin-antitoxin plasmid stabilization module
MIRVRESLKRIVWHGDSLERIRSFPSDARQDAGYELERVQRDREPRDWKPMSAVGSGVVEIRVHAAGEYRVFYITRLKGAVREEDAENPARGYRTGREEVQRGRGGVDHGEARTAPIGKRVRTTGFQAGGSA